MSYHDLSALTASWHIRLKPRLWRGQTERIQWSWCSSMPGHWLFPLIKLGSETEKRNFWKFHQPKGQCQLKLHLAMHAIYHKYSKEAQVVAAANDLSLSHIGMATLCAPISCKHTHTHIHTELKKTPQTLLHRVFGCSPVLSSRYVSCQNTQAGSSIWNIEHARLQNERVE